MPRIDDLKIQDKVFKKKEYRSWDENLLEKLNLTPNDKIQETPSTTTTSTKFSTNEFPHDNINIIALKQNSDRAQLEINKGSYKVQKEFYDGSNRVHLESNKSSTEVQAGFNTGSHETQHPLYDRVHLGFSNDKDEVNKLIKKLGGNEKKIFFYIINLCSIKGSLSTEEILGEDLNKAISTTRNGRETAIKRLIKKGLIKREKGKTGANGTLNLYVSTLIKVEALNYLNTHLAQQELLSNWGSNRVQNNLIERVQLEFNPPLYSSSNKITTTDLNDDWKKINLEPLRHIGFTEMQLKQISNLNTPEIVQESINHFAYALEANEKYKNHKTPLNVIMGVLRKGQGWFENNYRSPQEIAMAQMIERKKAERERMKKLEEEIYKIALSEWQESLSSEQLEAIAPVKRQTGDIIPQNIKLSIYFKENIWPQKKVEYLKF